MLILCGKTASGKDTILNELIKLGMEKVITYTTRPIRKGEEKNKTYYFIGEEEFAFMEEMQFFVETTEYTVANGEIWHYGTAKSTLEDGNVVIINPEGIEKIKNETKIDPVVVYIHASDEVIRERLANRGDAPEEAARRLEADNADFQNIDLLWDFAVRNENIDPEQSAKIIYDLYKAKAGEV